MKTVPRTTTHRSRWQPALGPGLALALLAFTAINSSAQLGSLVFSNRWSLAPGSRYDLPAAAGNNERGVAINRSTGNILLASRTSSNHIAVINGTDGSDLGALVGGTSISGGTLALVHVRGADDGVIYACNLYGGAGSTFKLYRWNSEADGLTNAPTVAFTSAGAPVGATALRYGDSMDIRGSGIDTQIAVSGSGSTAFAIFTTTDGTNFTATEFLHGLGAGEMGKGLCFDGTNNVVFGKKDGSLNLHKVAFNFTGPTANLVTNIVLPTGDNNVVGTKTGTTNGISYAIGALSGSGTTSAAHRFKAYGINNPSAVTVFADVPFPGPYFADANVISASDIANGLVVVQQSNNGLMLFETKVVTNLPPLVVSQPVGVTNLLTGGFYKISVGASGTAPLTYQWKLFGINVAGATNSTLVLTNIAANAAGDYSCSITNSYGFALSSTTTVVLASSVQSPASAKIWQLPPGSRSYLTADNNQRGLAFNAQSNHVLVVNRSTTNIHILDAATGAAITNLDMTGVTEQLGQQPQFAINLVGAAPDGAIYACNLAGASGAGFTIYRWADENPGTIPTIAYGPDFAATERLGDTFAVKGSGPNTVLLAATRNGTQVIVFTTGDGLTFNANVVDVTTANAGFAGLGLAAGDGDTFWATSNGGNPLRKVFYDLANGTNEVQLSLGGQSGYNIAVDPQNDFVADNGTTDTPSNVRLLDISDPALGGVLIDQEFFGADNDNGNGTGAVAFDVAGGRIFALDTNNGLIALKYAPRLKQAGNVLTWTGPGALQASSTVDGTYTNVVGATSPYTAPAVSSAFYRVQR